MSLPPWWGADEREEYEERSAILEYEANFDRATAEQMALAMVLHRLEATRDAS